MKISFRLKRVAEIQMSISRKILGKDNEMMFEMKTQSYIEPGWIKTGKLIYGN